MQLSEHAIDMLVSQMGDLTNTVAAMASDSLEDAQRIQRELASLTSLDGATDEQVADEEWWRGVMIGFLEGCVTRLKGVNKAQQLAQTHIDILVRAIMLSVADVNKDKLGEEVRGTFDAIVSLVMNGEDRPPTKEDLKLIYANTLREALEIMGK